MEITIKNALLNGRSLKVKYRELSESASGDITNDVTKNCGGLVHDDLLNAMDRLKIHLAVLCDIREVSAFPEEFNPDAFNTPEYLENVFITGITMSGEGEAESITIHGGKMHKGRVIHMDSPSCRRDSNYEHLSHLFECVDGLIVEIEEYLFGDKFAVRQAEFDFDGAENEMSAMADDMPMDEEPKPTRGRKKKSVVIPIASGVVN